jgi:hypothetical protein
MPYGRTPIKEKLPQVYENYRQIAIMHRMVHSFSFVVNLSPYAALFVHIGVLKLADAIALIGWHF